MNFNSPKSEPAKSFEKRNVEKDKKTEVASKPEQKPNNKPKNKIERPKIDLQKEPRNKIQREKFNPLTPSKNKIERLTFHPNRESIKKIHTQHFTPEKSKNKIEQVNMIPSREPGNIIEHLSIEKPKNIINYFGNLLNKNLQDKLKEYLIQTGTYANWGLQIKQNFMKNILEDEKNSVESLKHVCEEINANHEIQRYIIDLKRNNNFSNLKILRELREIGLNVSRGVVGKIFSLQTGGDYKFLTKNTNWSFLDRNEKGTQLSYEEKVKNAALFLKNKILTNQFKDKYELALHEAPKGKLLNIENTGFITACRIRKIYYNDILREAGLKINMERNKWTFLDRDETGKQLSYKEQVNKAAEYLNHQILTSQFKEKYKLAPNEAPKRELLSIENKGFTNACSIRNIYFNDILGEVGLNINMERNKWTFLDRDDNGKPLSFNEQVDKAAGYLSNNILTAKFKEKFNLKSNEGPMRSDLEVENHDFVSALNHRKIRYNDVLRKLGLKINMESGKWSFLDYNEKRESLSYEEQVGKASEYLKKIVLTKEYRTHYNLDDKEGPTISTLNNDHSDYFSAIHIRSLSYNDILIKSGYSAHDLQVHEDVGRALHWIEQSVFLQHTRNLNCNSFYEVYPNIKTKNIDLYNKYGLKRCDNAIFINDNCKKLSSEIKRLSESRPEIKMINFDYFLGNSKQKIIEKCLKGYQDKNKMLILVPSHCSQPQEPPEEVPYVENIKIMDPKTFANFIGYEGELREKFFHSLNIAKNALVDDNENRELICQKGDEYKHILKDNYNYNQKELEKFIEKNYDVSENILKYVPDKSTLDKWLLKKIDD